MSTVEQIRDPEALRQAALLLEAENAKLIRTICELKDTIARLEGKVPSSLQQKLQFMQELLDRQNKALFGASSEKRVHEEILPGEKKIQTGHGARSQSTLPIIDQPHALDPPDRTCPACGGELREIEGSTEDSTQISVIRRQFVIVRHRRQRYRCGCGVCDLAPAPLSLRDGARYSPEFAVEVALSKYGDHLPLDRQVKIMRREGLMIDSQTLWDQLQNLAKHLEPSAQAQHREVLKPPVVHADETPWRLMDKPGSSRWWVWSISSERGVSYRLDPSRSSEAAKSVLAGYQGTVIADAYGAYSRLARDAPEIDLAGCWGHARRKFVECRDHYSEQSDQALRWIGEMYAIEAECPGADEASLSRRARARNDRSRPIVERLFAWAGEQVVLPESGIGRALHYLFNQRSRLEKYLDNPRIAIDNNLAERSLRGVVVGRKNHYGSRSQRGTEVAAIFYTLIESAKLLGVEPGEYLLRAARYAIRTPGAATLPREFND
jgi:transposase